MKFAPKLSALLISLSTIIVAVILTIVYLQSERILQREISKNLESQAIICMSALDRFLYKSFNDIQIIAGGHVLTSGKSSAEEITERLIFYRNTYKWYASISFFDMNRIRIADTSGLDIGKQHQITRYWEDVYAGHVSAASDVRISEDFKVPIVYFASQVKNTEGKAIGVVVARMLKSRLFEILKLSDADQGKSIYIINKDGLLIYSNHINTGAQIATLSEWELIKAHIKDKISGSLILKSPTKEDGLYAYCKESGYLDFKGNGWTIILLENSKTAFASIYNLLNITIAIFLLLLPAIVIIAYLFSKSTTRSLTKLGLAADKIGKGKLDAAIDLKSNDEFGVLAYAMNKMASDLNTSKAELKEYSSSLEEKIKERTKELAYAKAGLEIQVGERTKSLKEKYEELNLAQDAMLFMIEDLNSQAEKLKDAQEKIIRSEKLATVGQLASSVAHELRNPLSVIKNAIYYLNMLKIGDDNSDIKENMDIISSEIESSDKIISDLLEFSRIKKTIIESADINSIIKETIDRLTVPKNIGLIAQLGENLPLVDVDSQQMQQVFYNLATNAMQAMEKGGNLTISSSSSNEYITVSFKDTGCGIPEKNLKKIFEPLFSTKIKGTGLGLSVVASIVEGHGGKINIESQLDKGTIFVIELPIKEYNT